jgi:hypothetical protein
MGKKKVVRKVYVCGVDWQHEMEDVAVLVQPSVEALKKGSASKCWEQCGVVELEVTFKRWVEPQDLGTSTKRESKAKPKSSK